MGEGEEGRKKEEKAEEEEVEEEEEEGRRKKEKKRRQWRTRERRGSVPERLKPCWQCMVGSEKQQSWVCGEGEVESGEGEVTSPNHEF